MKDPSQKQKQSEILKVNRGTFEKARKSLNNQSNEIRKKEVKFEEFSSMDAKSLEESKKELKLIENDLKPSKQTELLIIDSR